MLQNKNICVSLHSQLNMVPIVQLVRASDCGSECRGFESHWAPKRGSRKTSFFRIVGSATLRRPDLPWFSNNFAIDIFMPVILAEKNGQFFCDNHSFPGFTLIFHGFWQFLQKNIYDSFARIPLRCNRMGCIRIIPNALETFPPTTFVMTTNPKCQLYRV